MRYQSLYNSCYALCFKILCLWTFASCGRMTTVDMTKPNDGDYFAIVIHGLPNFEAT